jgi:hypothetical protein
MRKRRNPMSKPGIDVATLAIDELGRMVLSDDLLAVIEASPHIVSAGANSGCVPNSGCTNGSCGGSSNQICTNTVCNGASNTHYCNDGPIG